MFKARSAFLNTNSAQLQGTDRNTFHKDLTILLPSGLCPCVTPACRNTLVPPCTLLRHRAAGEALIPLAGHTAEGLVVMCTREKCPRGAHHDGKSELNTRHCYGMGLEGMSGIRKDVN